MTDYAVVLTKTASVKEAQHLQITDYAVVLTEMASLKEV